MKETAKLCIGICERCHKRLCIEKYDVDTTSFSFNGRKSGYIIKCVQLSCCDIRKNALNNDLYGVSKYHLHQWYFSKDSFQKAEKTYRLLSRYSSMGPHNIRLMDFSKMENATDEFKSLLSCANVAKWHCPYFMEHQMMEWNT